MDWKRWAAGAAVTAVPFIAAAFIKSAVGRSSLQFFGFGAGVRVLGKAGVDLMAKLFGRTHWGARMYDGEARAAAIKAGGDTNLYPIAGLGSLGSGCSCANCSTGVGACCMTAGNQLPPSQPATPALPVASQPANPVFAPPATFSTNPANPIMNAPPAAPAPRTFSTNPANPIMNAPPAASRGVQGFPRLSAPRHASRYSWGEAAE